MAHHIHQLESELQNTPEAAPSSRSFSVSEKLARYGSSALSGVEHLRLSIGKDSIADAMVRYFGSLKAPSRASFKELRQFVPKGKAEGVMAALSVSKVADVEHALSAPQVLGGNQWKIMDVLPAFLGVCYQRPRKQSYSYFRKSFTN